MHFSIPDTQEFSDNGSSYTSYNIHINGVFHCSIRYKQLHNLYEHIKKEFSSYSAQLPTFPSKKILPLTASQLEERRVMLEAYIQAVGQDPTLSSSDLFNCFLLTAQQETYGQSTRNEELTVFLMNGYKIVINILTNERSDIILEKVCNKINLPEEYINYFSLFLIRIEEDGEDTILRPLQDFEAPYISLKSLTGEHNIVLRKSYWDSQYDLEVMTNKVGLNLLYLQTVSDLEKGWILCSKETRNNLARLQSQGNKKEYLEVSRTLKFYGYLQLRPCVCDYPYPGSKVLLSIGNNELNLRVRFINGTELRQGCFKVTRMRCWRITTLHSDDSTRTSANLELSFEYLMSKDKLQWVTISSQQAILISMCLQSIVDELVLKKSGTRSRITSSSSILNYVTRNGSIRSIPCVTSSISSKDSSETVSTPTASNHSHDLKEKHSKTSSNNTSSKSMKIISGKLQAVSFNNSKALVENKCFDNDGIGDDEL